MSLTRNKNKKKHINTRSVALLEYLDVMSSPVIVILLQILLWSSNHEELDGQYM
jgi:hypothetical protein